MAETKSNKEKMDEIMGSLQQGVKDIFTSENFADYLKTMSKFHNYSLNNTILIAIQKPNASLVAGFKKWKDNFKRYVKRGEKGIKIIAPTSYKTRQQETILDPVTKAPMLDQHGQEMTQEVTVQRPSFTVAYVYDVSQTDGEPLPSLTKDIYGSVENFQEIVSVLEQTSPVPVEYEQLEEGLDGYFSPMEQKVVVDSDLSEKQMLLALVHEITHAKLHDHTKIEEQQKDLPEEEKTKPKDKKTKEIEAESVAFAVCSYFGIETGENSFGYIAGWSKNQEIETLKSSLATIKDTASELITAIDIGLMDLQKQKETVKEAVPTEKIPEPTPEPPKPVVEAVEQPPIAPTIQVPTPVAEVVEQPPIAPTIQAPTPVAEAVEQVPTPEPPKPVVEAVEQEPIVPTIQVPTPEPPKPVVEAVEQEPITPTEQAPTPPMAEIETIAPENETAISPDTMGTVEIKPDTTVTVEDCVAFGYPEMDDLYPLGQEKAVELFQEDLTVYALNPDKTEEMIFDVEEIKEHDGLFAVEKTDWDKYAEENHLGQETAEQGQTVAENPPVPEEKPPDPPQEPPKAEEIGLPTVADYEEAVNQGHAISILGLAEAIGREKEVASKSKEKPSILAQLKEAKQPKQPKEAIDKGKETPVKPTNKEER